MEGESIMGLQRETVATYYVDGQRVEIDLCWQGKEPEDDPHRFYDLYDADTGEHLNEGEPWYPEGDTPTSQMVSEFL